MLFNPYPSGGYQCKITTSQGTISVRTGAVGLFTTNDEPYEVRYPDGEVQGRQTADDIFSYIRAMNKPDELSDLIDKYELAKQSDSQPPHRDKENK